MFNGVQDFISAGLNGERIEIEISNDVDGEVPYVINLSADTARRFTCYLAALLGQQAGKDCTDEDVLITFDRKAVMPDEDEVEADFYEDYDPANCPCGEDHMRDVLAEDEESS